MNDAAHILVVDDEQSLREFLEIFFRRAGHVVSTAAGVEQARALLEADDVDVVVSDMQMADGSGLDVLRHVQASCPETPVIMITAFATTDSAIAAMKDGAYDYITKPFKVDELGVVVGNALEKRRLTSENRRLRTELRTQARQRRIVGNSAEMQRVFEMIAQVAGTKTNVLVSGESGTGKELVARAIHEQSGRADAPFVAVNCGAIPENLLESELFGHMKGAFTGAVQNKEGLFETADGGTLFLDEVGELSQPLQVKLLRAIQEKTIRRVGGTSDRRVDARIISATNRRLEEEVAAGRFREDLYYRLNVIQIALPPLRERRGDVPLLVHRFLERFSQELGKEVGDVDADAMELLTEYAYPGNVRELENVIERAVALSRGGAIGLAEMPPTLLRPADPEGAPSIPTAGVDLDRLIADYERSLIGEALRMTGGVKKRAARLLGVSFRSLRYRLDKLGMDTGRADEDDAG
ncbi:MAG: sigma-54-dependent Fis family transcriptional regulator [Myxococcales bacterium]|nr:sigma-54-dependent Fis family transcriptional regulator [Myxococcales bacterium]